MAYIKLLVDSEPNKKGDVVQIPDSRVAQLVENGTGKEITVTEAQAILNKEEKKTSKKAKTDEKKDDK